MIKILSNIYTSTPGVWAFIIFLGGAFFVLFSTFISAVATHSRTFTDLFEMIGWIKINSYKERMKYVGRLCIIISIICFTQYSLIGEPVLMIIIGGTAQAIMLPGIEGHSTTIIPVSSRSIVTINFINFNPLFLCH